MSHVYRSGFERKGSRKDKNDAFHNEGGDTFGSVPLRIAAYFCVPVLETDGAGSRRCFFPAEWGLEDVKKY